MLILSCGSWKRLLQTRSKEPRIISARAFARSLVDTRVRVARAARGSRRCYPSLRRTRRRSWLLEHECVEDATARHRDGIDAARRMLDATRFPCILLLSYII